MNRKAEHIFIGGIGLLLIIASFVLANKLFGDEFKFFAEWWFAVFVIGAVFMPLCAMVFKTFADKGWMFSKTIGIAVSGWLVWYFSSVHILKFTRSACIIALGICLVLNGLLFFLNFRKKVYTFESRNLAHIILVEGIFLVLFVFWLYLKGFNPYAYGTTEKLMDYAFMVSMDKSEYMPPNDMWLSGQPLNYYYVGLFMSTYLSKLSGCGVHYGYNMMLMMISALGFSLPASIIYNAASDKLSDSGRSNHPVFRLFPAFAGALAGIAVSFTGNMQYVIYAKIIPALRSMFGIDKMAEKLGYTFPGYWFPNATRYIGYNPETEDKTIHEFPLYSFVLGDLHAHVINIIFVLSVVAVLYAFIRYRKQKMDAARLLGVFENEGERKLFGIPGFWAEIFHPCVILTGFFVGLFHTTNFWDYPIYFVVAGAVILFSNAVVYDFSLKTLKLTFFHAVVVIVVEKITCLPFTLSFNQISSSIMLCENRTPLYQLLILWGLPVIVVLYFLYTLIRDQSEASVYAKESTSFVGRDNFLYRFIGNLEVPDMFVLILGLCAIGLILIPEVIYVRDIYSGAYKRANTMFKLTYQAFILFGMAMGYIISRLLFFAKNRKRFVFAVITGVLLLSTTGYFNNSTKAWFGDWSKTENYKELRCDEYLKTVNKQDYNTARWINDNIEGRPVLLELNGASYKDYNRLSIMTGLQDLLGWKTHEQLWQWDGVNSMAPIITERETDIKTLYTSTNAAEVKALIDKYGIEYIYIGDIERAAQEREDELNAPINYSLLESFGTVVYPAGFTASDRDQVSYLIKID
jgi:YYY domain-containing protein